MNLAEQNVMFDSMPPRIQPPDMPVHPLRQWRNRLGLSQTQVAELAATTQGMIGHIERYKRIPRTELLERLVRSTGLPAEAFVLPERFVRENPNFLQKYGRRKRPQR